MTQIAQWERVILLEVSPQSYTMLVEAPANKTYTLDNNVASTRRILNAALKTASGTLTAKLQKNGVDITNLTTLAVTSTISNTVPTNDGTSTLAPTDVLTVVVSGVAAPTDFSLDISYQLGG